MYRGIVKNGLLVVVLFAPIAVFIIIKSGIRFLFEFKIPVIEPVLWVLFLIWIVGVYRARSERSVRFPPLPVFAFLVVMGLSAVTSSRFSSSFKELVQYIDCFFIAYVMFLNAFDRKSTDGAVSNALVLMLAAVTVYGGVQLILYNGRWFLVRSFLDDRNILGAFCAIGSPVLYGFLLHEDRRVIAMLLSFFTALAIVINSACASLAVMFLVLVLMCLLECRVCPCGRGRRSLFYTIPFGAVILVALFARIGAGDVRDLIFEPRTTEGYHRVIERNIGMSARKDGLSIALPDSRVLFVSTSASLSPYGSDVYLAYVANELRARSRDGLIDGERDRIKQRFLEWQAALYALGDHPLLGTGPGGYQYWIGLHYRSFPRLNTLEPSTQNGYLVIASTTGFLGFSCFIWILGYLFRAAWRGMHRDGSARERGLSIGLFGALGSFAASNIFYDAASNHATLFLFVLVAVLVSIRSGDGVI